MKNNQYNNLTIEQFNNRKGITLIEMVVVIVIVGLAIPVLMLTWQDLAYRSGRSEVMAQGTFYAQELMEEIKSKTFDDVDDFNNYSDNPQSGYTRTVTVVYLDPNISDGGTWQVLSSGTSDFKRITVSVSHRFIENAALVTMMSRY